MRVNKLIPNKWLNKFKSAKTKNEKIKPKDNDNNINFLMFWLFIRTLFKSLFIYPAKLTHKEVRKNMQISSFIFYKHS